MFPPETYFGNEYKKPKHFYTFVYVKVILIPSYEIIQIVFILFLMVSFGFYFLECSGNKHNHEMSFDVLLGHDRRETLHLCFSHSLPFLLPPLSFHLPSFLFPPSPAHLLSLLPNILLSSFHSFFFFSLLFVCRFFTMPRGRAMSARSQSC